MVLCLLSVGLLSLRLLSVGLLRPHGVDNEKKPLEKASLAHYLIPIPQNLGLSLSIPSREWKDQPGRTILD